MRHAGSQQALPVWGLWQQADRRGVHGSNKCTPTQVFGSGLCRCFGNMLTGSRNTILSHRHGWMGACVCPGCVCVCDVPHLHDHIAAAWRVFPAVEAMKWSCQQQLHLDCTTAEDASLLWLLACTVSALLLAAFASSMAAPPARFVQQKCEGRGGLVVCAVTISRCYWTI